MQETAYDLDETLYARFASEGDLRAMEQLVARWQSAAFRVASCICRKRALAEEAVQEAFLQLLTRKAQFKTRGTGSFRAWFLSLVTNCARMARRADLRSERKKRIEPQAFARRKSLGDFAKTEAADPEWGLVLERALDGLEECWRTPVARHFLQGERQSQVAMALGVSQQVVSKRIQQGLAMLRERLNGTWTLSGHA